MRSISQIEPQVLAVAVSLLPGRSYRDVMLHVTRSADQSISRSVEELYLANQVIKLSDRAKEIIDQVHELGHSVLSYNQNAYPEGCRELPDPPSVLYLKGEHSSLPPTSKSVSVVGSRKAPLSLCSETILISKFLAEQGVTIVSGLALGIDGAAHRGAIQSARKNSCPTVAVVAHGLDQLYPVTHRALFDQILEHGGLIISEYSPGTEPLKHHFLGRNRIIAALSSTTVVVQAGARSGSLVTAQVALDCGREVCVYRGQHGNIDFAGGDQLIDDGAVTVDDAADILTVAGISVSDQHNGATVQLSVERFLKAAGVSMLECAQLELKGAISILPGNIVECPESMLVSAEKAELLHNLRS